MTPEQLTLPLRGLASAGIGPALEAWFLTLPGVLTATVHESAFHAHVTYDPTRVTPERVRERLQTFADAPNDRADG